MPRKSLQLNDFSGGLNTKSSPRDIQSNEVQKADNVVLSNPGLIEASSAATDKVSGSTTMTHTQAGNGAFMFNSQFNVDTDGTATQPSQIIAYPINKDSGNTTIQFFRRNFDSTGVFTQEGTNVQIDMQVTGEVEPVYYYVDGVLYISDKKVVDGDSDYEPRKLQYVSEDRFAQSITGWNDDKLRVVATDDMFESIESDTDGNFATNVPSAAGEFLVILNTDPSTVSQTYTNKQQDSSNIITTTNPGETAPSPNEDINKTDKTIYLKTAAGDDNMTGAFSDGEEFFINGEGFKVRAKIHKGFNCSYCRL